MYSSIQPDYDGMLAGHLNRISAEQAEESCREAEMTRLTEEYGERIIRAWADADDLCFEDYQKMTQADFEDFIGDCLMSWGEQPHKLDLEMPTWQEYLLLKQNEAA